MTYPRLSHATAPLMQNQPVMNEYGETSTLPLACERPLTLYLNKREIVTLMTLGEQPEALVLGYLRNQGFVTELAQVISIQVDWEVGAAAVVLQALPEDLETRLAQRTVTTGCGQGTVFGQQMDRLDQLALSQWSVRQSDLYQLLDGLQQANTTYREAGGVHACALCDRQGQLLAFCEDIGRHNAVDSLAGQLWLENLPASELIFYTTGRLTSEMVIKAAQMGISVLLSRSGATVMGLELAQRLGILLIARARGTHFQVFHGAKRLILDAKPAPRPSRQRRAPAQTGEAS